MEHAGEVFSSVIRKRDKRGRDGKRHGGQRETDATKMSDFEHFLQFPLNLSSVKKHSEHNAERKGVKQTHDAFHLPNGKPCRISFSVGRKSEAECQRSNSCYNETPEINSVCVWMLSVSRLYADVKSLMVTKDGYCLLLAFDPHFPLFI